MYPVCTGHPSFPYPLSPSPYAYPYPYPYPYPLSPLPSRIPNLSSIHIIYQKHSLRTYQWHSSPPLNTKSTAHFRMRNPSPDRIGAETFRTHIPLTCLAPVKTN
ncbi:hypothetical protein BO71DRAFT_161383 [Aspergillus ellipticus CBS 707.79]|uniref:Uncharacterized protein n=1 Tax=Aspergillus ellipticus CBS 707.79 TaxID=1448320 RepID=A0A319DZF2_9EURO|nr:hypothetical protein BO71DRAFT_161383 [Aspergillus ellipticus CBS 707.79]